MRAAGALLYDVLQRIREVIRPGETTAAIDAFAEEIIRRGGAVPSFLHYRGYPASICASVDDVVVHGIPSDREVLREGSILSVSAEQAGWAPGQYAQARARLLGEGARAVAAE